MQFYSSKTSGTVSVVSEDEALLSGMLPPLPL